MRRHRFAIFAGFLVACGPEGEEGIQRVFDPCTAAPSSASSDSVRIDAIRDALALWKTMPIDDAGRIDRQVIPIQFESAAPMFHGVYDDERGIVFINSGLSGKALSITIAHELGHAFGLAHISPSTRSSVMNPNNLAIAPTSLDMAALRDLWGECPSSAEPLD